MSDTISEEVQKVLAQKHPIKEASDEQLKALIKESMTKELHSDQPKPGGVCSISVWRSGMIRGVVVNYATATQDWDAEAKDFTVGDIYGEFIIDNIREARRMAHLFVEIYQLRLLEEN